MYVLTCTKKQLVCVKHKQTETSKMPHSMNLKKRNKLKLRQNRLTIKCALTSCFEVSIGTYLVRLYHFVSWSTFFFLMLVVKYLN